MAETNPPKGDRIGNDFHEGPNTESGGEIDTGDSLVPPYDGRNRGRNERSEGPERMLSGGDPPKETGAQPESPVLRCDDARRAPEGVGESMTRGGATVSADDAKEAASVDIGSDGSQGDRPTGASTPSDVTGVHPKADRTAKSFNWIRRHPVKRRRSDAAGGFAA